MRRVVAYNKRHLAQEGKAKQDTKSKSYKSLKNWGHDAQKTLEVSRFGDLMCLPDVANIHIKGVERFTTLLLKANTLSPSGSFSILEALLT